MISAQDIRSRTFSTTKFREGYDIEEVDDYLDELAKTLGALEAGSRPGAPGLVGPQDVLAKVFDTVKFREGYSIPEVDDLLDVVVQALQEHQALALATGSQPVAGPTPAGAFASAPVGSGLTAAAAARAQEVGTTLTAPLPPDPHAAALGARVLVSQLQIASVRTLGNDALVVVTPDGNTLRVVAVDASPQGVVLRTV